jgi:hypothetical protein
VALVTFAIVWIDLLTQCYVVLFTPLLLHVVTHCLMLYCHRQYVEATID